MTLVGKELNISKCGLQEICSSVNDCLNVESFTFFKYIRCSTSEL